MEFFGMEGVDLKRLQLAHQILAAVVDRLVEMDEAEPDRASPPLPNEVEIDGTTPHQNYCRDCHCSEGMDW